MFARLPGQQGEDIFAGATTTVRSAFPNSRLDSLNNHNYQSPPLPPHHNHQSHQSHNYAAATAGSSATGVTQQPHGMGNQLLSPYDPAIARDVLATTATTLNNGAGAAADAFATASSDGSSSGSNLLPATDDDDWWSNAIEEDTFDSPLAFDASENGLWNGRFVPPPPRPPFLDESVAADGLTTCDLCTWAWQRNAYSLDGSIDASGEIGWAFTLIVVSIISALIGAIVMVVVLRCKRIKSTNANGMY
ncbi:uncharacterized protein LOC142235947 [Haematobia irritans]|uniref:uncharacterized protein LOC142235947 n=1 Tax=Haematobia irritans TaxID=7368 RepID=UPI003F4F4CF3